jgi:hypothetical protein
MQFWDEKQHLSPSKYSLLLTYGAAAFERLGHVFLQIMPKMDGKD